MMGWLQVALSLTKCYSMGRRMVELKAQLKYNHSPSR